MHWGWGGGVHSAHSFPEACAFGGGNPMHRGGGTFRSHQPAALTPLRRVLVMGMDQAKWVETYHFAQTVLKYYEKVGTRS